MRLLPGSLLCFPRIFPTAQWWCSKSSISTRTKLWCTNGRRERVSDLFREATNMMQACKEFSLCGLSLFLLSATFSFSLSPLKKSFKNSLSHACSRRRCRCIYIILLLNIYVSIYERKEKEIRSYCQKCTVISLFFGFLRKKYPILVHLLRLLYNYTPFLQKK